MIKKKKKKFQHNSAVTRSFVISATTIEWEFDISNHTNKDNLYIETDQKSKYREIVLGGVTLSDAL